MNRNEIELESFAKINLHLDIKGKLENGFHEIYSVFQLIDLSDTLKLKIIQRKDEDTLNKKIQIKGKFNCKTEDNLIYKVIIDFEKESGLSWDYYIDAEKRIPDGAGLGGGSSNAAYILYSINKMHGFPLQNEKIIQIAEKNGSDIPFFLKAHTALVKGRGEKITAIEADLSNYSIIIICPDFKISTKEAYNLYDSTKSVYKSITSDSSDIMKLLKKNPSEWGFFNSFTPILSDRDKIYPDIFKSFQGLNCEYCNITGSGSAVFGIFSSISDTLKASDILKTKYKFVWSGKMLAGKPLLDK